MTQSDFYQTIEQIYRGTFVPFPLLCLFFLISYVHISFTVIKYFIPFNESRAFSSVYCKSTLRSNLSACSCTDVILFYGCCCWQNGQKFQFRLINWNKSLPNGSTSATPILLQFNQFSFFFLSTVLSRYTSNLWTWWGVFTSSCCLGRVSIRTIFNAKHMWHRLGICPGGLVPLI